MGHVKKEALLTQPELESCHTRWSLRESMSVTHVTVWCREIRMYIFLKWTKPLDRNHCEFTLWLKSHS